MPSLNLDLDYFDHVKTKRLVALLGRGAEVLPIKLWSYCGKFHAESGRLAGYAAEEIETIAGWWGKPGRCIEALLKVGFLERDGDDLAIHEWTEHEGHIGAFKVRAKKGAAARWDRIRGQKTGSDASSNASSNALSIPKQCPVPNHTKPNHPPNPPPGGDDRSELENGNALDDEIRTYVGGLTGVLYSPRLHGQVRQMVESGGWVETRRCLDVALSEGAARPGDYALSVMSNAQAKQRVHTRSTKPTKEWAKSKYCPG